MNALRQAVFNLSPDEKLALVQDLWDDLATVPSNVPLPDGLSKELDRREARLKADPQTVSWDDVKASIRAKYGAPEIGDSGARQ